MLEQACCCVKTLGFKNACIIHSDIIKYEALSMNNAATNFLTIHVRKNNHLVTDWSKYNPTLRVFDVFLRLHSIHEETFTYNNSC